MKDSVERLVRRERDSVYSRNLGGVNVAGNQNDEVKKLRKLCADRRRSCIEASQFERRAYSAASNVDYEHAMGARYSLWDEK